MCSALGPLGGEKGAYGPFFVPREPAPVRQGNALSNVLAYRLPQATELGELLMAKGLFATVLICWKGSKK